MFKKLAALLPILALTLTGCTVAGPDTTTPQPSSSVSESTAPVESATPAAGTVEGTATQETVVQLNELTVTAEADEDKYDQDQFKYWVRKNDTGCDTRFAVLKEESLIPMTSDGCDETAGEWFSSYDGVTVTDPSDIDIDHMIPRSEAWNSGASKWTAEKREEFANDLTNPKTLVAVSFSSNRSKGNKDPAKWMPTTDGCVYVSDWIDVKHEWNLSVDVAEKKAMINVLSFCKMDDATAALLPDPATVENADGAIPAAPATEEAAPAPVAEGGNDPQYGSCKEAQSNGYGPYIKGQDAEYEWYRDGDNDGDVCE